MSGKPWVAILGLVGTLGAVCADGPPGPGMLPPLVLPIGADGPGIPHGQTVSRPLQPVELEPAPPGDASGSLRPPVQTLEQWDEVTRPLPNSWTSLEYLIWWPSSRPLPPLVTAARGPNPPVLGGPNTVVLIGGSSLDSPDISGARFTHGFAVNQAQTAALAVSYFFLGSRTVTATAAGTGRPRLIGRPIIDAETQEDDVVPVVIPGSLGGGVDVSLTTRLTGWEVNGVTNLLTGPNARLNALAGYRYFMANEGLRIDQLALFPTSPSGRSIMVGAADQFDAHNRFHGGQLGLAADWARGPVYVEAVGKIGFGRAINVVKVSGQTVAVAANEPTHIVQWFDGGVLGQPTNAGRHEWSGFAVLPEAGVKIGYRFRDRSRLYIGYNFIYLSEAVRPGDQIDLTVDESQVPLLGRPSSTFADRPGPILARSDFWVQGLVFGLEYRY